jgi:hypothetical protein
VRDVRAGLIAREQLLAAAIVEATVAAPESCNLGPTWTVVRLWENWRRPERRVALPSFKLRHCSIVVACSTAFIVVGETPSLCNCSRG